MDNKRQFYLRCVGAALFGAAMTMTLGAASPTKSLRPRYSVYHQEVVMYITDNDSNKQYIYVKNNNGTKLCGYVDLNHTGSSSIKGAQADKDGNLPEKKEGKVEKK